MEENPDKKNEGETAIVESMWTRPGGKIAVLAGCFLALVYLLNPTAGIFEWIPDNLPIVGNLDEAAATALLLYGLRVIFKPKG